MVELVVANVETGRASNRVRLIDRTERMVLTIWVGGPEALAIDAAHRQQPQQRPRVWNLVQSVLDLHHTRIQQVNISKVVESTFHAEIVFALADGQCHAVDARPSDALALALGAHAPIYVEAEVLDHAGAHVQQLVSVGPYRLALSVAGHGAPTVVLESGLGGPGAIWQAVQHAVAAFSRVVSYDRAGIGASEWAPAPRTCHDLAVDLHRLLNAGAVPPPYILVGASLGGLTMRVFADLYPQDVAGVVLVDSAHPDQYIRQPHVLATATAEDHDGLERLRVQLDAIVADPFANPEGFAWQESAAQVRNTQGFRDRPLVVLTAGRNEWPERWPSATRSALQQVWRDMQRELASLSTRSRLEVVADSGHRIEQDQPGAVVAAIRSIAEQARN